MKKLLLFLLFFVLSLNLVSAATLKGTVYNTNLDPESNVLVKLNTIPEQRLLSRDGNFQFTVPLGTYTITAQKSSLSVSEQIPITSEGNFIFDLFLFPEGTEEAELWNETEQNLIDDASKPFPWRYVMIGVVIVLLALVWYLWKKTKKVKDLETKGVHSHHQAPEKSNTVLDDTHLDKTLDIIKKHEGRISQKDLRKEMMHLSEAKISLILTELEHKGKIEKIKKGRGNVVILK